MLPYQNEVADKGTQSLAKEQIADVHLLDGLKDLFSAQQRICEIFSLTVALPISSDEEFAVRAYRNLSSLRRHIPITAKMDWTIEKLLPSSIADLRGRTRRCAYLSRVHCKYVKMVRLLSRPQSHSNDRLADGKGPTACKLQILLP